jgi:hypothetical protein
MAEHEPVPEADALEQALPPRDADPELIDVDEDPEIDSEVPETGPMEQGRLRAVPATVAARPIPFEANEQDVIDQRLPAGQDDDEDDFR